MRKTDSDRIVESTMLNSKNNEKMRPGERTSKISANFTAFTFQGSQKKKKDPAENLSEETIAKILLNLGKETGIRTRKYRKPRTGFPHRT